MWRQGEGKPVRAIDDRFFNRSEANLQHLFLDERLRSEPTAVHADERPSLARLGGWHVGTDSSGLERHHRVTVERGSHIEGGQRMWFAFEQHPALECA